MGALGARRGVSRAPVDGAEVRARAAPAGGASLAGALLLLFVALPSLGVRLADHPAPWFDEGYKMNAAATLARARLFGTRTSEGDVPFDPGISAGPTLIAPGALAMTLLGPGVLPVRLVSAAFAVAGLVAAYGVACFVHGRRAGLFIALIVALAGAAPDIGLIQMGRQFLGEAPAFACAMIGALLWFHAWQADRTGLAALAGVAFGLSVLAKAQFVAGIAPALAAVAWVRLRNGAGVAATLAPMAVSAAVVMSWSAAEFLFTPAAVRLANAAQLRDAVASTILPGGWGRQLTSTGVALSAVMMSGAVLRGWRVRRATDAAAQGELFLVFFTGGFALWFALASIGWPRYAFGGVSSAAMLWGRIAWDARSAVARRWAVALPDRPVLVALALLAIAANVVPALAPADAGGAVEMGEHIRTTIPRDSVIESWEWELDALSGGAIFHHPPQRMLFLAVRRWDPSRPGSHPSLGYDPLVADPDYLISGPFSEAMRIYDATLRSDFRQTAKFGRYRLFERVRRQTMR